MKRRAASYILAFLFMVGVIPVMYSQDSGDSGYGEGSGRGAYPVTFTLNPDIILTQHWAMPTLLNPAATGEVDFIRIRAAGRLYFLGSHQSPKNFIAAADSPFKLFGKRIGAGLLVNSGTYGVWSNLQLAAQGSYKINIKKSTISIGLQIGYFSSKFKGSEYVQYRKPVQDSTSTEGGEEEGEGEGGNNAENSGLSEALEMPTEDIQVGVFDVALGVRYEHPKFHVGLSALHLTNPTLKLRRENTTVDEGRYLECKLPLSLYFDAGGNINIKNTLFTLQPSLAIGSNFKDIDAVAVMAATYKQMLTFGVDYRWNKAVGVVAGLTLKNFYIGYNWEYDYSDKPYGSTGNHELVLGYQFKMDMSGKSNFRQRSIRIM